VVIGNPYKFSIILQIIEEWNVDYTFGNGVLMLCVDGNLFPNEIVTATLKCEVAPLIDSLNGVVQDERLFSMSRESSFAELYNCTFPENLEVANDYRFLISPMVLSDEGCFVFAIKSDCQVRILASKLCYNFEESRHELDDAEISETIISLSELQQITDELAKYILN